MRARTQVRAGPFVMDGCGWLVLAVVVAAGLCLAGALGAAFWEYP